MILHIIKQVRQCTCNLILRFFLATLLQWNSIKYHIFCVCVCRLRYPVWNSHAPCCYLLPGRLYNIFHIIS